MDSPQLPTLSCHPEQMLQELEDPNSTLEDRISQAAVALASFSPLTEMPGAGGGGGRECKV